MTYRDRIKDFRRVPAGELRPNPKNWRMHPTAQRDALRRVLDDVGYADALLARELPDGSLELIDGHLRAETTPDQAVPVLVLDVDAAEAGLILATHDPLGGMATVNVDSLSQLMDELADRVAPFNEMLRRHLEEHRALQDESQAPRDERRFVEPEIPRLYQVVVECDGDDEQRALYERLTAEGHRCRLLML